MDHSFEATLVRQCALTLAGMKAGSLFSITASDLQSIRSLARHWDQQLGPLGLCVRILLERRRTNSALVYVYRPGQLRQLLTRTHVRQFLEGSGYQCGELDRLLEQLSARLREQEDFPHEIGVFLGYPLRDVMGFIQHQGQNFTCCGLWKSYGNPEAMNRCFSCFRCCIDAYVRRYQQGTPIQSLAIPA